MTALSAADYGGRFIHYGIREHGMAAAMNGMALHGGVDPYSAARSWCSPTIAGRRFAWQRSWASASIHVMTHDSIGLGEDGPTHQPVEHLAALRAIPNISGIPPLRCGGDHRVLADSRSKRTTARACWR